VEIVNAASCSGVVVKSKHKLDELSTSASFYKIEVMYLGIDVL